MHDRTAITRYGIAVGSALASLLIRIALLPLLGSEIPYITFFPAILLSAWFGGKGPGLCATLLGGAGVLYGVIPPVLAFKVLRPVDVGGLLLFVAIGGIVSYLTASWRDATARLRESERIYRTIGEAIDYGVWICAPDGRNTYASESFLKLVGMTQKECAEFGWKNVLHPDDQDRTIAAWKQCVRTEGTWDMEHRFMGVDGEYHRILARGAPVRDEHGRILCWAGINLDITGLRQAEQERTELFESLKRKTEELSRSNRELEQFAFAASHDLQEPLRTINIYTQLLLREVPANLNPSLQQYAQYIKTGVERLHSLITDLLSYSRTVHSEPQPDARGSMQAALDRAMAALQPLIAESGASVDADPLPDAAADETQLAQLFQNLLSNALKYRDTGRTLRLEIRAASNGQSCTVSVRDNGLGFRPEYAEQIFGLFKRLHRDDFPGTGLGLAICKRIVERYGGTIWAEATLGEGACFYFTLPVAPAQTAVRESADSAAPYL